MLSCVHCIEYTRLGNRKLGACVNKNEHVLLSLEYKLYFPRNI